MKLVIATPLYPPEIGGPATYVHLLERGLPQKGIQIEVVKFSEVRHLPRLLRHYAYYRRLIEAAKDADLILALDPVSVGLPAAKAAQKLGKRFVVKIVGDYAWEQGRQRFGITATLDAFVHTLRVPLPVWFLRQIQTYVAKRAATIIVPSRYLKGVVEAWGIRSEQISVIYNAISLENVGEVPPVVAALARPLVVTAGRLVPWKHMDGIIEAVASVPHASLAIVGDGPLRSSLEKAAEPLQARVVFTGQLSHEDTLAVLQSADAFVLNSSYEGLSHLLVEACMLGVPTIATRVGGNPEVITGESGMLVEAGNTKELAAALTSFLADSALRSTFSAQAKEAASTQFSLETMLSKTTELLTTV